MFQHEIEVERNRLTSVLCATVPPTCGPGSTEGHAGGFDLSTATTSETGYDAWQAEINRAWANYVGRPLEDNSPFMDGEATLI